jgi:hypothetical protein
LSEEGNCQFEQRSDFMRTLFPALATTILFATSHSALAESKWLESGRLEVSEIKVLCDRVSDVGLLGRMQMITSGDDRWRRLSRLKLVIETAAMGVTPLDPSRCYVIARAGLAAEEERRAFEVRDFTSNTERTSVFVIGRAYDAPLPATQPNSR